MGVVKIYNKNDEAYVVYLLKEYGSLPKKLVISLLAIDEKSAESLISTLVKKKVIYCTSEFSVGLQSSQETDSDMIYALWLVAEYRDRIGRYDFYKANEPYKIIIIMNNRICKITVVKTRHEYTKLRFRNTYLNFVIVTDEDILMEVTPPRDRDIIYAVPENLDYSIPMKTRKYVHKTEVDVDE